MNVQGPFVMLGELSAEIGFRMLQLGRYTLEGEAARFGRQELGGRRNGCAMFRRYGGGDLLHRDHNP